MPTLDYPPPAPTVPERTAEDFRDAMYDRQRAVRDMIAALPQLARDAQANFAGVVSRLPAEDVPTFGLACYQSFVTDKTTNLAAIAEFLAVAAEGLNLPNAPVTAATLAQELLALCEAE